MPNPGEVFELAFDLETPLSGKLMNIYDFTLDGGSCTDGELLTAISSIMTAAYSQILTSVHDTVSVQQSKVNQMIWQVNEWIVQRYVGSIFPSLTFTNANDALPHATSGLVRFLTVFPRVVGKKYLPVFGENIQDASFIGGPVLADMVDFGTAITTPTAAGAGYVNYAILRKNGRPRPHTRSLLTGRFQVRSDASPA
jgi:hypothetical protein